MSLQRTKKTMREQVNNVDMEDSPLEEEDEWDVEIMAQRMVGFVGRYLPEMDRLGNILRWGWMDYNKMTEEQQKEYKSASIVCIACKMLGNMVGRASDAMLEKQVRYLHALDKALQVPPEQHVERELQFQQRVEELMVQPVEAREPALKGAQDTISAVAVQQYIER